MPHLVDGIVARRAQNDPQSARLRALNLFAMMAGTLQTSRALSHWHFADELLEQGIR